MALFNTAQQKDKTKICKKLKNKEIVLPFIKYMRAPVWSTLSQLLLLLHELCLLSSSSFLIYWL